MDKEHKLRLRFSYTKYNKCYFVCEDEETAKKLARIYPGGNVPDIIPVLAPRGVDMKDPPESIKSKLGLTCVITVTSRFVKLRSQADHNYGELISTISLTMLDIEDASAIPIAHAHVKVSQQKLRFKELY